MSRQNQDVYAPVNAKNNEYDERKIVDDEGNDPIRNDAEDAIAAIKGHIERQDMEGTAAAAEFPLNTAPTTSGKTAKVTAKENYKLDNSHISVKE